MICVSVALIGTDMPKAPVAFECASFDSQANYSGMQLARSTFGTSYPAISHSFSQRTLEFRYTGPVVWQASKNCKLYGAVLRQAICTFLYSVFLTLYCHGKVTCPDCSRAESHCGIPIDRALFCGKFLRQPLGNATFERAIGECNYIGHSPRASCCGIPTRRSLFCSFAA